MANNDSVLIPYVIQEGSFWYVAYKEKAPVPEIVVSSKGVANGLSEEYNDGWDFGPDSYDPTSTANPPYTQTSGIQEAVNYVEYLEKQGIIDDSNAVITPTIPVYIEPGIYFLQDEIDVSGGRIIRIRPDVPSIIIFF